MTQIKAIETKYKGYRFRSRLEARWAVALDAWGLKWEYEKEGFDIDGEWYLPDFWIGYHLPGWGHWIEIKPQEPNEREILLFSKLVELTGHRGFLVCGNPWPNEHFVIVFGHHRNGRPESIPLLTGQLAEVDHGFHDWLDEGWYMDDYAWHIEVKDRKSSRSSGFDVIYSKHKRLTAGFQAARSARFEHGETP